MRKSVGRHGEGHGTVRGHGLRVWMIQDLTLFALNHDHSRQKILPLPHPSTTPLHINRYLKMPKPDTPLPSPSSLAALFTHPHFTSLISNHPNDLKLSSSAITFDTFASGNICLIPGPGKENLGYITTPILLGYDLRKASSMTSVVSDCATRTDRIISFILSHGYSWMANVYF